MFICERCNKKTKPHTKQYKVVVQVRQTHYPDSGTTGWEIVKELKVCKECTLDE